MKETGLMFKAPLVRAILEGRKTQTRRIVKGVKHFPDRGSAVGMVGGAWHYGSPAALGLAERGDHWSVTLDDDHLKRMCTREAYGWGAGAGCPMGQPGDRIYVRETWQHANFPLGPYQEGTPVFYRADYLHESDPDYADAERTVRSNWLPSIHMPKQAARIWLEITGVRVERLQSISESDAQAEGCSLECMTPTGDDCGSAIWGPGGFKALWESTGGDWAANPWVWVIDFKRIKQETTA